MIQKLMTGLLLVSLTFTSLDAQDYVNMDFENGFWVVSKFEKPGKQSDLRYHCDGDTTISDTIFSKMYFSKTWIDILPGDTIFKQYAGAIAEFGKKVQFVPAGQAHSTMIYDFDLSIGDTVEMMFNSFIINGIDSVEYCGVYHKRYYEKIDAIPKSVIEGIGYSNGILGYYEQWIGEGENITTLDCYMQFNNPDCQRCGTILSNPEFNDRIQIYPNPTRDLLTIHTVKSISTVFIIDPLGRTVLTKSLYGKQDATLILSGLKEGLYHLQILYQTGEFNKINIIKQ